jgi:hypothetical protein
MLHNEYWIRRHHPDQSNNGFLLECRINTKNRILHVGTGKQKYSYEY